MFKSFKEVDEEQEVYLNIVIRSKNFWSSSWPTFYEHQENLIKKREK